VRKARPWILALGLVAALASGLAADEGWLIERMEVAIAIQSDGSLRFAEAIDVDFRGLVKHGIYRDITAVLIFDDTNNRQYPVRMDAVTTADGRAHQVQSSMEGSNRRFRIGDPNRTISGKETYRLAYTVDGALNGFADHDELFWNAVGPWPVQTDRATVTVSAPSGAIQRVECFQGPAGSREPCDARFTADEATFAATRPLVEQERLTVVVGLAKGAVPEPRPRLVARARNVNQLFETGPVLVLAALVLASGIGGVGGLWWWFGRDRRYVSLLGPGAGQDAEERVPLFGARPLAVEFQPPDGLRPGQMGLLVDERADTLDVTATIVDLAVRGYLRITELEKTWIFGRQDWQLDRLKPADGSLLEYERIVLTGLFSSGDSATLSSLKNKFYKDLARARTALYADAVKRGWFPQNPNTVRTVARLLGVLAVGASVALTAYLGTRWGAGFVGLAVFASAVLFLFATGAMPRRTAAGRQLMRRTLGFARYIRTGEQRQQAFAERANIFTTYLPYAIVFRCVEKWANAFRDIDTQAATAAWYTSSSGFDAGHFSSSLGSFSSSVSSTIGSTPGGSGSSGFGGSSGGGGGGGGGGSW